MKTIRYCYDQVPVEDFAALCERFAGKPLQSPYRSTVPLLSLMQHSRPQWDSLMGDLGAPTDAPVHLEYRVASPKVSGNPSQTDALIVSDAAVWAVEAKWTEPRYATVAERISKPEADGADPRVTLKGWLDILQPHVPCDLHVEQFSEVVYQMLHRAASACAVAAAQRLQPKLIYLHFHPSPQKTSATTEQYRSDLEQLHSKLGNPKALSFILVGVPLDPTPEFEAIRDLNKRSPATWKAVSAALCREALFRFGTPVITRI